MTDEAVGLMNSEVGSLNDLGMTGRATELHSPFQFSQMLAVGKSHIFVDHVFLEVIDLMALKTGCIANLRMRLARSLSRNEIGQRDLAVHPLALQMVEKPGLIMTFRTGYILMTGCPP